MQNKYYLCDSHSCITTKGQQQNFQYKKTTTVIISIAILTTTTNVFSIMLDFDFANCEFMAA